MFYVYVLKSNTAQKSFVGFADDVDKAVADHNAGKIGETKQFAPWILIYKESYAKWQDAKKREEYLKGAAGASFLKNIWEIV